MDKFDNKLNFDFAANQRVMQLIGVIDGFKGKWNTLEKRDNRYLKELREIAVVESVGASTRMDGATLINQEVKQLLQRIKTTQPESRDEENALGYYETLELIYGSHSDIKLSENSLKQLHQLLFKYNSKEERHRGAYKHLPNQMGAVYPTGEQQISFATTGPALVKGEMYELLTWVNRQSTEATIHPLIIIAVFIYEFLCIYPFQEGNGRLSRLLTTLCLLRERYEFIQYISFENLIEEDKKEYYGALISGQQNRNTHKERVDKWLIFFLEKLKLLSEKLEKRYNGFKHKGKYLNKRQKRIRDFVKHNEPLKVSDLAAQFPEISLSTLKKDLQYLRYEQVLEMIGKGKGCIYLLKEKKSDGRRRKPL